MLIIGIPFVILFFGSVRVLSLVEGRIVEVMLGERMPRRPLYTRARQAAAGADQGHVHRSAHVVDAAVHAAMLPLGIVYFTVVVTLLSVALSFMLAPVLLGFGAFDGWWLDHYDIGPITLNDCYVG